MTRNPPDNGNQYGYGTYGYGYQEQQPQYGQGASYGQPAEPYNYSNYQQPNEYVADQGHAQSYYGSNSEPYQQYPQHQPMNQPPPNYYQGGPAAPYAPQQPQYDQYNGQPPHAGVHALYEQQYPQHHIQQPSGEVDAFRSHFDNPNAPPDPQGHFMQPPAGPYPPPGALPGAEADRGLMGALAGGAMGAYGGHKVNHGFLGTIGGAVAGSLAEDAYKKHNKKEKKHKQGKKPHSRRGSSSSSSSSSSSDSDSSHGKKRRGPAVAAGNFHASSNDIRLDRNCILVASCRDVNGHSHQSELDLNDCLTNTNGRVGWARGGNFAASARNIRLADRGRVLEMDLGDGHGGWVYNEISLNDRIGNDNGRLHML